MNYSPAEERYQRDNEFRALVDMPGGELPKRALDAADIIERYIDIGWREKSNER